MDLGTVRKGLSTRRYRNVLVCAAAKAARPPVCRRYPTAALCAPRTAAFPHRLPATSAVTGPSALARARIFAETCASRSRTASSSMRLAARSPQWPTSCWVRRGPLCSTLRARAMPPPLRKAAWHLACAHARVRSYVRALAAEVGDSILVSGHRVCRSCSCAACCMPAHGSCLHLRARARFRSETPQSVKDCSGPRRSIAIHDTDDIDHIDDEVRTEHPGAPGQAAMSQPPRGVAAQLRGSSCPPRSVPGAHWRRRAGARGHTCGAHPCPDLPTDVPNLRHELGQRSARAAAVRRLRCRPPLLLPHAAARR